MGKIKIHEIAKELGVESKEIIASAQKLGIEVTSHLSRVEDESIVLYLSYYFQIKKMQNRKVQKKRTQN